METRKRITLSVDKNTYEVFRKFIPTGHISSIVTDLMKQYIRIKTMEKLENSLKEGYQEYSRVNLALSRESAFSDYEILPEA